MEDQKTFKTKHGHEVVIRTYLTGSDKQRLQGTRSNAMKVEVDDQNQVKATVDPNVQINLDNVLIEQFVISVDGVNTDLSAAVLNMRVEDYDQIIDELRKVAGELGLTDAKKKNSANK